MSSSKCVLSGIAQFSRTIPHRTLFPIPQFLPSIAVRLNHRRYSAAVDTETTGNAETINSRQPHPWPEWVTFVDRLKTRGYFIKAHSEDGGSDVVTDDATVNTESVYRDMNQLKDPCLSFARDRYDIFKLLSITDIQTVVEGGCPNLLRKAVNSAKRLRAYFQMNEADVCSACNLRGSCDRAYVILKDVETNPRTVDIVRILLFYALNPFVISGGEKPHGRELVEAAARKLLSELIELSETVPEPTPPKSTAKAFHHPEQGVNFSDDKLSQNVEMKRGDWMCPKCNFLNFSKNIRCLKCSEEGPRKVIADDAEMDKRDWTCSECGFMNFSRNIRCLKCKAQGPKRVGVNDVEMKKGDWNCPGCGFMNFASNKTCLRCREPRPKRRLNPGEWECPSCDFLNFWRNAVCLKCNCERTKVAREYE